MSDFPNSAVVREKLQNEKLPALREAGLIPEEEIDWFEDYREHYEPGDGIHFDDGEPAQYYYNSQTYVNRVRRAVSKTLSNAVRGGNLSVLEHASGLTDDEDDNDLPFAEYLQLERLVHGDEFRIFVFTGGQGGGKSYFAYLLAKYKSDLCERDNQSCHVVTNSLTAVRQNEEIEELIDSPEKLFDYRLKHDGQIVFVFDEASSFLDSKAAGNAADLAKFVPFLRRLRKMDIMPIIVSHRAMDVGTDIRNLDSVIFIDKPNEQTAVIYDDHDDLKDEEEMFRISGYSTERRYEYDTDDLFISWRWDGLDDVVEYFSNPEEFRELWEEYGTLRDLRSTKKEIDRINDLEDKRRDLAMEAVELDGFSQAEIADIAGVDVSTLSKWLSS